MGEDFESGRHTSSKKLQSKSPVFRLFLQWIYNSFVSEIFHFGQIFCMKGSIRIKAITSVWRVHRLNPGIVISTGTGIVNQYSMVPKTFTTGWYSNHNTRWYHTVMLYCQHHAGITNILSYLYKTGSTILTYPHTRISGVLFSCDIRTTLVFGLQKSNQSRR